MRGVCVNYAACRFVRGINPAVQDERLACAVPAELNALPVDLGEPFGLEKTQAGVARRNQKTVRKPRADVAGGRMRVAALKERPANAADFLS